MIYLLCYIVVGFLLTAIDKRDNRTNKIILFLAIAILTILAALRDKTIGFDVIGYPYSAFCAAERVVDIRGFISYMDSDIEWGYRLLAFVCTKIFHSLNGVLFGTALIINGCVIIGVYRVREHISMSIAILSYCFLFYQETYNMMRQWIAMAIIIFGITYIVRRKFFRYCLVVLAAALFHRTAVIGILLYIIAELVRKKKSLIWQVLIVLGTVFCVINIGSIVEYFIGRGLIDGRFLYYVTGNTLTFSFTETIVRIPPIVLCFILYSNLNWKYEFHKVWFLFLLIDLIICQLHSVMDFSQRIGSYFTTARIFELGAAVKDGNQKQMLLVNILVILYLLIFWLVYYVYFNFGSTYPYIPVF